MRYWAMVSFEFEGYHRWDEAPEEVWFLKTKHRHLFKCRAWVEQEHTERDVEYIILKRKLLQKMLQVTDYSDWSCEKIAQRIVHYLGIEYPGRKVKVEVTEDGENGAIVETE